MAVEKEENRVNSAWIGLHHVYFRLFKLIVIYILKSIYFSRTIIVVFASNDQFFLAIFPFNMKRSHYFYPKIFKYNYFTIP